MNEESQSVGHQYLGLPADALERLLEVSRVADSRVPEEVVDRRDLASTAFSAARYLTILGINTTINARSLIVAVPTTTFSPSRRLRAVCTRP